MGIEIERKFLVSCYTSRTGSPGIAYRQGYLCEATGCCVRIRTLGLQEAWLTVKGHVSTATRLEYEYPIPLTDATEMLAKLCGNNLVEKTRFRCGSVGTIKKLGRWSIPGCIPTWSGRTIKRSIFVRLVTQVRPVSLTNSLGY